MPVDTWAGIKQSQILIVGAEEEGAYILQSNQAFPPNIPSRLGDQQCRLLFPFMEMEQFLVWGDQPTEWQIHLIRNCFAQHQRLTCSHEDPIGRVHPGADLPEICEIGWLKKRCLGGLAWTPKFIVLDRRRMELCMYNRWDQPGHRYYDSLSRQSCLL